MPAIANLALQNNAATAVTGTALVPSSGDQSPARWRVETAQPPFARPTIEMVSRFNKNRTARHVDIKLMVPYSVTDTTTNVVSVQATCLATVTAVMPTSVPTSVSDDFVAYLRTILADSGVVACLKAGYAPT